jgi:uncharacterized protein (DUF302 family)
MADYGRRVVIDAPFDRAVAETSDAFRAEGFCLLSTIDVRDYLARKADHECRRYLLLSACLAELTLEVLQHDPEAGAMMQTAVAIFELPDGETAVTVSPAFQGLAADFGWRAEKPEMAAIADRAAGYVARAIDRLRGIACRDKPVHAWSA